MRLIPGLAAALGFTAGLAVAASHALPPRPRALGCVRLALGPAVDTTRPSVAVPALFALRAGGRLAAAETATAALVAADTALAGWTRPARDSLAIGWRAGWLGGAVEVRLAAPGGSAWQGRYALSGHTGGAGLRRGDALALAVPCPDGGVGPDSFARDAEGRLARWRAAARPDTARAVAEALADYRRFLREVPIHALSVLNYRIATFACRHGRLPATLAELRSRPDSGPRVIAPLEAATFVDAWGRTPRYRPNPPSYEVRSAGPDGRFGTADDLVSALDAPLRRDRATGCE